ncbi:hypothetical protein ACGF5C_25030 [Micromonospora sp. NPDC047620]|uniref:hypothetical protein n=1 Tax=Micromonospora sp. NPDC047620 TaxID=3364251 RepID=UPI003712318F
MNRYLVEKITAMGIRTTSARATNCSACGHVARVGEDQQDLLSHLLKWFGGPSTKRAVWPERAGPCDGIRDVGATIQAEQDEIIQLDHWCGIRSPAEKASRRSTYPLIRRAIAA